MFDSTEEKPQKATTMVMPSFYEFSARSAPRRKIYFIVTDKTFRHHRFCLEFVKRLLAASVNLKQLIFKSGGFATALQREIENRKISSTSTKREQWCELSLTGFVQHGCRLMCFQLILFVQFQRCAM